MLITRINVVQYTVPYQAPGKYIYTWYYILYIYIYIYIILMHATACENPVSFQNTSNPSALYKRGGTRDQSLEEAVIPPLHDPMCGNNWRTRTRRAAWKCAVSMQEGVKKRVVTATTHQQETHRCAHASTPSFSPSTYRAFHVNRDKP